ncbi:LOW QUALITY PROTEIN: cadherin-16 [Ciconia maguari]
MLHVGDEQAFDCYEKRIDDPHGGNKNGLSVETLVNALRCANKLLCHQNQFAVFKLGVSFVPGCATVLNDPSTPNAELQYKILTQTPSQSSEHLFQIDSRTWTISSSVEDSSVLDTSQVSIYHLIVQVKDLGNQSLGYRALATVETAIVENTQVAPGAIFLPKLLNVSYPQIISKRGPLLFEWELPLGLFFFFFIDPARNIYATLELDRESQAEHEIVLAGNNDRLLYSDPLTLLITVMDENDNLPVFTQESYQIALKENTAKRSEIITVNAENINDPKTNNSKIAYEILRQEPQVSNGFSFRIDARGDLTMGNTWLEPKAHIVPVILKENRTPSQILTICLCTEDRQCREAAERTEGKPTVISAVFGIIVGTTGTIGV